MPRTFLDETSGSGVPRYTVKTGSSAAKRGRSSRAKADSTCSHSVLSALMLLLLPSLAAEEPVFTVYLGSPLGRMTCKNAVRPSVRPSVRSPKEEGVSDVLHRVLPPFLSIYRVTHKDGKNLVLT